MAIKHHRGGGTPTANAQPNQGRRQSVPPAFPERLLDGYRAFHDERLPRDRTQYQELARSGQHPEIMVISCCDSRVAPETIFDAAPGEIFVVRNVANLVPPYTPDDDHHGTSAALEYAVQVLKVKHIIVLGHGGCGGVHAFREQSEGIETAPLSPGDFIGHWISLMEPAKTDLRCEAVDELSCRQRAYEEASIRNSIHNLHTFPCVRTLFERGQMQVHGAWFDIASGELWMMDADNGNFHRTENSSKTVWAAD